MSSISFIDREKTTTGYQITVMMATNTVSRTGWLEKKVSGSVVIEFS
jgi:hypothetical protein